MWLKEYIHNLRDKDMEDWRTSHHTIRSNYYLWSELFQIYLFFAVSTILCSFRVICSCWANVVVKVKESVACYYYETSIWRQPGDHTERFGNILASGWGLTKLPTICPQKSENKSLAVVNINTPHCTIITTKKTV